MLQHNIAQFLDGNELCYLIPDLRKVQGGARINEYGFLLSNDQIRVAVQRHLVVGSTHPVNAVGKGDWLLTVHRHKQSPFLGAAVISLLYSGRWRLFLPVAGRKRKRKQKKVKSCWVTKEEAQEICKICGNTLINVGCCGEAGFAGS